MAVNLDKVSLKIFNIVKSFDNNIKLFKDTGEPAFDPETEARKYYLVDSGSMITLDDGSENYEIKVIINHEEDFEKNKRMISTLRQLATDYGLEFTTRVFDKKVNPKDFAYQAHSKKIQENISLSKSASSDITPSTRIVVKHSSKIDEVSNQRVSSKKIFIEDGMGQRTLFPFNNMHGARAMARHIDNNGTFSDDLGKYIIDLTEKYEKLKIVKKATRNLSEVDNSVVVSTDDSINSIGKILRSLQSRKGYAKHSSTLPVEVDCDADTIRAISSEIAARCSYEDSDISPFEVIAKILLTTTPSSTDEPKTHHVDGHIMENFVNWIDNEIGKSQSKFLKG